MDRAVSPECQALAVEAQDADPAAVVLGDVNDVVIVDIEERRADQLGRSDRQQFAVLVEHLHPVAFYNHRGACEQWISSGQGRDQLDPAVAPFLRRQRGSPSVPCPGI